MEKNFTSEDSLKLINSMLDVSKQNLRSDGIYYILFGSIFLLASLVQYLLFAVYNSDLHWLAWFVAGIPAALISILLSRKKTKQGSVTTYLTRLNMYLWIAFVIGIFFIVFLGIMEFIPYGQINPLIIMLYGFATFITGGILKFRWLQIGAILAWIIAVLCAFQEYSVQMLLVSLTILVSYLIPGFILNYSKEKDA